MAYSSTKVLRLGTDLFRRLLGCDCWKMNKAYFYMKSQGIRDEIFSGNVTVSPLKPLHRCSKLNIPSIDQRLSESQTHGLFKQNLEAIDS